MTQHDFRRWMASHRYTVRGLADVLGVTPTTIQRYRSGKRPIPTLMAWALKGLEADG